MPPKKIPRTHADAADASGQEQQSRAENPGAEEGCAADPIGQALLTALRDNEKLQEALSAASTYHQAEVAKAEEERDRLLAEAKDERDRLPTDAKEAAAKITEEAERLRLEVEEEREALALEKAAMEKTHTFQKSRVTLNVGGHRFETSLQTLTSVPDTYFASLFSGRFELAPDNGGVSGGGREEYFIDRDGDLFHYVLSYLRDPASFAAASTDMKAYERIQLETELEFYGLLDRVFPFAAQERIGRSLLERALRGHRFVDVKSAVKQARCLVFEMNGMTSAIESTPFLNENFNHIRYVITDQFKDGSPVWVAVDGKHVMYREGGAMKVSFKSDSGEMMVISHRDNIEAGHTLQDLISNAWRSYEIATLPSQYAAGQKWKGNTMYGFDPIPDDSIPDGSVRIPYMHVPVVHGLADDDPMMVKALKRLAELS